MWFRGTRLKAGRAPSLMVFAGVDLEHEGNRTRRRAKTNRTIDETGKKNLVCMLQCQFVKNFFCIRMYTETRHTEDNCKDFIKTVISFMLIVTLFR